MQDDEKMFQIGVWSVGVVLLISVILQVAFRTQNRQLNRVRREIVATQQQIAVAEGKAVTSPLPGVIIAVKVNVGDAVKAGQVVAILEAMKMENEIQAESDGTVTAVNVAKGDSVLEGAAIVTIG